MIERTHNIMQFSNNYCNDLQIYNCSAGECIFTQPIFRNSIQNTGLYDSNDAYNVGDMIYLEILKNITLISCHKYILTFHYRPMRKNIYNIMSINSDSYFIRKNKIYVGDITIKMYIDPIIIPLFILIFMTFVILLILLKRCIYGLPSPFLRIKNIRNDNDDDMCCICLEMFKYNERIYITECFHKYHIDCFDHMMMFNTRCALCRTNLIKSLDFDALMY